MKKSNDKTSQFFTNAINFLQNIITTQSLIKNHSSVLKMSMRTYTYNEF